MVGSPESVDDSSLLSDLHSMVQSAVDCRQEQQFKPIVDMIREILDCLIDKHES